MKKKILFCTLILAMAFASGACNKNTEPAVEEPAVETTVLTLEEMTKEQKAHFKVVALIFNQEVKDGTMTYAVMEEKQEEEIANLIEMKLLPDNAVELFREWKVAHHYEDKFMDWIFDSENEPEEEVEQKVESKPIVQNQNKPKPTEKQEQTQHKEVTQKPVKPSNNTPSDGEVVGTPGEVISAGGGESGINNTEDIEGLGFESSLAEVIALQEGISFEEALQRVRNGEY